MLQFVTVEAVSTVVVDLFPVLRKGWNREIYTFFYCAASYVVGLTMVTNVSKLKYIYLKTTKKISRNK